MTTALEERIAREEARGEQLDTRLSELREDMRAGFDRVDRAIEGLRSEFNSSRNLVIGGMITLGIGMVILFLTIILRSPG